MTPQLSVRMLAKELGNNDNNNHDNNNNNTNNDDDGYNNNNNNKLLARTAHIGIRSSYSRACNS
eukprot:CAMPEP_0115115024 /NCGR_PEP_ID=MMETSP0227-20121206/42423_1 /TAXON_ID=89957 /ORGANISM="Polarella glacialis, Strain CCMP 1383" /LENGTH=63 /DNA_ID=CAMNT_0002515571 /DNA_START=60 /DNA_END=251 /DNA_ORIENTATION=+